MGYMGLKVWGESDNAADMTISIVDDMVKRLKFAVRKRDNEYNTSGCVNVGLFNEAFILPAARNYRDVCMSGLRDVLSDARDRLLDEIKEMKKGGVDVWSSAKSYQMHLKAYQRMVKNLNASLRYINE